MHRLAASAASRTAAVVAALVITTACSIPDKQLVMADAAVAAKGLPFACVGQLPPSTANPRVTLSGTLIKALNQDPVPNAPIEIHVRQPDVLITTIMTSGQGEYTYNQATGGVPQDAYLRAAPSGFVETRFYPAAAIASDLHADIQLLTAMDLATIAAVAGITVDPTKATFLVTVLDCNGDSVSGATVTTSPKGTMLYFANGRPSTTAVATDGFTGTAIAANVDVSNTTISAVAGDITLKSHSFDSAPGVLSQTEMRP